MVSKAVWNIYTKRNPFGNLRRGNEIDSKACVDA